MLLAAFLSALSVAAASEPFTCDCSWTATHPCDHPVRSATTTSRASPLASPRSVYRPNAQTRREPTAHTGPPRPSRQDTKPQTGWLGLGGTDECHYYCCPAPPPSPPPPLAPCHCDWVGRDGKHVCPHMEHCPGLTPTECGEIPASQRVAHPERTNGLPADVLPHCFDHCCEILQPPSLPPTLPPPVPPPSPLPLPELLINPQGQDIGGLSTNDIPLIFTIITIIIALPLFCCATCCLYRTAMKEAEKDAVEAARHRALMGV
mmetsp:Transcript_38156/g.123448  ORF Transcript_38156/g.123448 Transcript_38156/m.123448 type:complete len:262 (+) Transcript_38156:81-866(+)